MRERFAWLWVVTVLALSACTPPSPQLPTVVVRVSPTPATVGTARIMLEVQDTTGVELTGATVRIDGLAPESDDVVTQREALEETSGRYVVDAFRFPSAGVWTVEVSITTLDGVESRVRREVRVVGGGTS